MIENEPGEGERWKASTFAPFLPLFHFAVEAIPCFVFSVMSGATLIAMFDHFQFAFVWNLVSRAVESST